MLHHAQGKGFGTGIGVALAGHILHTLIQTGVAQADGGVAAKEQLVDLLALLQAGQCAVLPQNGGGIAGGAHQALMAGLQCLVAESQALIKDLPELIHILMRAQRDIGQVDGHDALVKATIVLGLVRVVV